MMLRNGPLHGGLQNRFNTADDRSLYEPKKP
jgi:hypothetical protein